MPLTKPEADRLIDAVKSLVAPPLSGKESHNNAIVIDPKGDPPAGRGGKLSIDGDQLEAIYRELKNRLIDDLRTDPILLQLVAQRPEIILEIEPQVVTLDVKTLKGRCARLIAAGWFATARATSAVRRELARTGADPGGGGNLAQTLNDLVRDGFLTREGEGLLAAPGMKVSEKEIRT